MDYCVGCRKRIGIFDKFEECDIDDCPKKYCLSCASTKLKECGKCKLKFCRTDFDDHECVEEDSSTEEDEEEDVEEIESVVDVFVSDDEKVCTLYCSEVNNDAIKELTQVLADTFSAGYNIDTKIIENEYFLFILRK